MGKLAFYRAMEGAGKGMSQGIVLEEAARQKKWDREHDDRMTKLRMDAARDRTERQTDALRAIATERTQAQGERHTETIELDKSQFAAGQSEADRRAETAEAAAQRREGASMRRFESSEKLSTQQHEERMQAGKLSAKQTGKHIIKITRVVPGETTAGLFGASSAKEDVLIQYDADEDTLKEFKDGRWISANLPPEDEKLIKHPDEWQEYYKRKGLLPQWFIEQLGYDPSKTAPPGSR